MENNKALIGKTFTTSTSIKDFYSSVVVKATSTFDLYESIATGNTVIRTPSYDTILLYPDLQSSNTSVIIRTGLGCIYVTSSMLGYNPETIPIIYTIAKQTNGTYLRYKIINYGIYRYSSTSASSTIIGYETVVLSTVASNAALSFSEGTIIISPNIGKSVTFKNAYNDVSRTITINNAMMIIIGNSQIDYFNFK